MSGERDSELDHRTASAAFTQAYFAAVRANDGSADGQPQAYTPVTLARVLPPIEFLEYFLAFVFGSLIGWAN